MKRAAFTMIELIFIIVVVGILAGVALPKIFFTRDDAMITKARTQIVAIQSAISAKFNESLMSGGGAVYPNSLEGSNASLLFDGVLVQGIKPAANESSSGWRNVGNTYTIRISTRSTSFTYNATDGSFTCDDEGLCEELTQ
ncbi:prepilin-type cleavage/methylation domain-containing protein [Campylobacter sp. RM13119]|uniref:type II secretion system protein n=1 Tax=Campylobacter californiensis TaxID=1032243 RepID=UPI0014749A18|nr:type II secretion system protein [Campylobacter sp. RM13119]MBE3606318.1 prepilin-type cleavage/methylation domain-containing protein [Campylobacter sp. RM13119]